MTAKTFDGHREEPLAFQRLAPPRVNAPEGVHQLCFEYTSRGDRVPGWLVLPGDGDAPHPLLIVQHGARSSAEAEIAACAGWALGGVAVAAIDLPLHGGRTSAKLSERFHGIREATLPPSDLETLLWIDFVQQSVVDLHRALAALSAQPEIEGNGVGFLGHDLGSVVGLPFCAAEPAVRAAVFSGLAAGLTPEPVDPLGQVSRLTPRPLLFVNASHDSRVPRARAEALHAAAPDPKRVHWLEGDGSALPATTRQLAREFLGGDGSA